MGLVDRHALKSGDVLLSRGTGDLSDIIVQVDGGHYSHAAVWVGEAAPADRETELIEAAFPKVRKNKLESSCDTSHYIDVYRFKPSGGEAPKAAEEAKKFVGKFYGKLDLAIATGVLGISAWTKQDWIQLNALYGVGKAELLVRALLNLSNEQPDERYTCIEVVCRAYANSGMPITVQLEGGRQLTFGKLLRMLKVFFKTVAQERRPVAVAYAGAAETAPSALAETVQWLEEIDEENPRAIEPTEEECEAGERHYALWSTAGRDDPEAGAPVGPAYAELPVDEIRSMPLEVGKDWSPGLVTPRQLQLSPSLEPIGCVHQSTQRRAERSLLASTQGLGPANLR